MKGFLWAVALLPLIFLSTFAKAVEECCNIIAVDDARGVVTAVEITTGRTFAFTSKNSALLSALKPGMRFNTRGAPGSATFSLTNIANVRPDWIDDCCNVISAVSAPGVNLSPQNAATRERQSTGLEPDHGIRPASPASAQAKREPAPAVTRYFTIGEDDGFGGTQGGNSDPGDRFTHRPCSTSFPCLPPGRYEDRAGLDRATEYGAYRFEFNFSLDTTEWEHIDQASLLIQSGSVSNNPTRGFGHARVLVNGTDIGELWAKDTGERTAEDEALVREHRFDIRPFISAGSKARLEVLLDGDSPGPLAQDDTFALDFVQIILQGR